ncbi:hypothetical protein GMORB2_0633 [Geosmithia morbida]|uniref:Uncharacterized protein n=1 Tax=Geosmithia morbida TaxID=1094350 RepID=A0A9P4Z3L3_9HYPO|nr:uncharacterized protein GMORB2_0633 [Geosmithia morbida]KAF4126896.1 hypothetical protein GMORB2_0633 [Geosmithia morbida]
MAMWPFRRRSDRKRSRSGAALSDAEGPPARSQTESAGGTSSSTTAAVSAAPRKQKKKQRTEPAKLQRRQRAYSFSPGRQDDLGADNSRGRYPSPQRHGQNPSHGAREGRPRGDVWDRTPTLYHNQASRRPDRPKNVSKKKKKQEARDRAAEVRAMSTFDPVRPAAEDWTSGRPMMKESKRIKSTPHFYGRPPSDVSLPLPGSIHSSLSSESEFQTFRVSALASLAPRPTLRYTASMKHTQNKGKALAGRGPVVDDDTSPHRRVDYLADDLNARDLRELMEREDRRRERKRQRDRERAERRLARQAEQQKAEAEEARKSGTPPPENLERGVAGRDLVGLGIDPASTRVTTSEKSEKSDKSDKSVQSDKSDKSVQSDKSDKSVQSVKSTKSVKSVKSTKSDKRYSDRSIHMADAEDERPVEPSRLSDPLPSRREPEVIPEIGEPGELGDTASTKPQDSATSLAPSSRLVGILRSKKSKSRSTLASERDKAMSPPPDVIDEEATPRHSSWSSDKRGRFSLSSFIRWGGRHRRSSGGPPSFSNTSREEMQASSAAAQPQTPAQALARLQSDDLKKGQEPPSQPPSGMYLSRGPSNGARLRTKSRFREDLPELPISPPDSRMQSPEAEPARNDEDAAYHGRAQPMAIPPRTQQISPEPPQSLSISLASIDSEGSWLSGRLSARRSAMRESIARANRIDQEHSAGTTQEDLGIADDDYMARLAPHHQGHASVLIGGRASSDDGDEVREEQEHEEERSSLAGDAGVKLGAVGGSRPHIVHPDRYGNNRSTIRSQEGLLNIESGDDDGGGGGDEQYDEDDDEEDSATTESPVTSTAAPVDIQRARSVNLGKGGHVRNFSAGSAKLLDITPRNSVDTGLVGRK